MLLDSFAWMEYFMGTQKGEKVKRFLDDDMQLYTSPIVIAEIYSKSLRTDGNAQVTDSFILASARNKKIKVVTGDPHFKDFEDAVML
ncbi:MAG: hypothetical protein KJ714_04765 [Euryarchaeota archaeon]|nr:hypothetical protein [Euryarchaeota archaeon]